MNTVIEYTNLQIVKTDLMLRSMADIMRNRHDSISQQFKISLKKHLTDILVSDRTYCKEM